MYCHNCGKEISESVKFCPHCGTEQNQHCKKETKTTGTRIWRTIRNILIILVLIPMVILSIAFVSAVFDEDEESRPVEAAAPAETADPTEITLPENGWYALYGDRYYFKDGLKCVELHEIDGNLYYFDEEGVLSVNKKIPYNGVILHAGHDGRINELTYEAVYGKWAEESYHFGNSGSSSILEFHSEVENCDSFTFYLESNGERGAKVNGTWKVYIRCNGKWEYVDKISYTEPMGTFDFSFDEPKTFDAITAYPTVQGNASYSSLFYLQNVHCYL